MLYSVFPDSAPRLPTFAFMETNKTFDSILIPASTDPYTPLPFSFSFFRILSWPATDLYSCLKAKHRPHLKLTNDDFLVRQTGCLSFSRDTRHHLNLKVQNLFFPRAEAENAAAVGVAHCLIWFSGADFLLSGVGKMLATSRSSESSCRYLPSGVIMYIYFCCHGRERLICLKKK